MDLELPYNPNNGAPLPPVPLAQGAPNVLFAHVSWLRIYPTPASLAPRPIARPRNQTFHAFPLLPPELRLKIWAFALPHRVIELRSWGTGRYCPPKFSVTPHRLPVLFRICRESRTEALRLYKLVEVGVSAAQLKDARKYVEWRYHPTNPQANPEFTVGTPSLPYAIPYPPVKIYLSWENDVVYLGPEFQAHHLHGFLTGTGAGHELSGLQNIALSHNLWQCSRNGPWWDELRHALYSLKTRPVKDIFIVPDDEVGALEDRWYYKRHEIKLLEPEDTYHFRPNGGERARTVVENLQEWFGRMWDDNRKKADEQEQAEDDDDESVTVNEEETEKEAGNVPTVCIKSIRRNGRKMANFRDGLWGIQEAVGDMRYWMTWNPPEEEETF